MKRLFTIMAVVLLTASLFAQSPQKMSYQAVIRDATNHLVITQVGMQISILQGSENGTAVYVETHTTTPNINGLVTIMIGAGTKVSTGAFSDIDWSAGPYYILTETAIVPPLTSYTIFGTSQILSVPYSLSAKKAEGISGTITSSQVSDFQTSVTNNAEVLANTAKISYPASDQSKLAGIATGANIGVVPNVGITGATKTKITYDAKGLVTAGDDATTADIAASSDKNYVTNAQQTVINNTSGTNTGDQDIAAMVHTNRTALDAVTGVNTGDQDLSGLATTSAVTTLLNTKVDKISGKGLSAEDYTTVEKTKLSGIVEGAEVNINADWDAASGDAQILNKPALTTVATTGNYDDLSNKPTLDGSETKVSAGSRVIVSGVGTAADPYIVAVGPNAACAECEATYTACIEGAAGDPDVLPICYTNYVICLSACDVIDYTGPEKAKLAGIAEGANVGVVPNTLITGATKTKITYDAKGLVTAGTNATTADIAVSTDKNYVTDAQLTVIGHTSGTNTGDYIHPTGDGNLHVPVTGTTNSGKVLTAGATAGAFSWETPTTGGSSLAIGDSYGGGIIFWLDASGQHGLIAATEDQSTGIQWSNGTYKYTGTAGDGLFAGSMNTALIVSTQISDNETGNFAAKVCADYSVTVEGVTYGDWYLPSKYELYLLYLQKTVVGSFEAIQYWSSSETSTNSFYAWTIDFSSGGGSPDIKPDENYVRAVRAF